ncbi:YbbR-like domain-containing protein [Rhodohalobacter sp.]|uniref:CdaR family protein n=1 Tax=Rhodohalobacter sp. TaxID=1974210 RepID=UPI002ACD9760|nr:CdaR family protein [Rhodohalobacter sp.]MDZ7754838.1 CdaR family protein [Rhodohalobacter sp.]
MNLRDFITNRFKVFFTSKEAEGEESDENNFFAREKVIVFSVSFVLALSLWFVVNMNREFNITVQVPVELTNLPDNLALRSDVPENISVNVSGEGWNLISLYSNPPKVSVDAESRQINLFEQIRNMSGSFSELNVSQVDPIMLTIETEEKATKRVPIVSQINLNLQNRYGLIGEPEISPDSITLTGAESRLQELSQWETEEVTFEEVSKSMERVVNLKAPTDGVILSTNEVNYQIDVAEFTEAEVRVPVRTRNLPSGEAVSFNPSSITIRYDVPIHQYTDVQGIRPYAVYVDYADLQADDTGYITPRVEKITDEFDIRLRSFQPQRVSYFNIIPD